MGRVYGSILHGPPRTIHQSQGLSLDDVVSNPCGVNKHGLAYIALSWICTKEKLYLLTPLTTSNFQVENSCA
jgi:hypothetical protein